MPKVKGQVLEQLVKHVSVAMNMHITVSLSELKREPSSMEVVGRALVIGGHNQATST
jgi:hypothetical protein